MNFYYAARKKFGPEHGEGWTAYLEEVNLPHLTEVVSLDSGLNPSVIEDKADVYDYLYHDEDCYGYTGVFKNLEAVKEYAMDKSDYNTLALLKNPQEPCKDIQLDSYKFIGYSLLEYSYWICPLINSGNVELLPFNAEDLTSLGLVENYSRIKEIRQSLIESDTTSDKYDCNLWAIWREVNN